MYSLFALLLLNRFQNCILIKLNTVLGINGASISIVQLNPSQPRFYPTDTYDTYATSALLTAVQGTKTYAFGVWFKPIAYPSSGVTTLVFTMTMLEYSTLFVSRSLTNIHHSNYYPDKTSSVPASQQHLSRMLCFALDSSGTLTHHAPTFALPTRSFTFGSSVTSKFDHALILCLLVSG